MKRLTTITDRLLSRFVPERTASADCWWNTYYICDGGPKYLCRRNSCTGEEICELRPGWCW
ncbi:hypothetical protein Afil01_10870 [Actinorhabdospora filicis]|uniref:Uncharacterized protein n=1 Tax=Actinorhabdospora filicis TaxID=1785913 RepID=A0A9W6W935_9ACTN|nr:hypothetical protein [Actinorhabdospora filicis]GLZ76280.1 hypothetical protein Afil01_10870 [Actinorhabdospora filicis]